jgi:F0F1-type ATP synthase assembly protein I
MRFRPGGERTARRKVAALFCSEAFKFIAEVLAITVWERRIGKFPDNWFEVSKVNNPLFCGHYFVG